MWFIIIHCGTNHTGNLVPPFLNTCSCVPHSIPGSRVASVMGMGQVSTDEQQGH